MKIFGVVGWKNNGKTGLMERLVEELSKGGLRVSTIKHAHHRVDVDQPGKDSYRHRQAGASEVVLVSENRVAIMQELRGAPMPELEELLARLSPVDLVLVEGFKGGKHPKIEVSRRAVKKTLLAQTDQNIIALAADHAASLDRALPIFDLDDTAAIADFVLGHAVDIAL